MRWTRLAAPCALALALAACGPAPDRVRPENDRLSTDDLARTVLEATGAALRLPTDEIRGTGDARRCDDRRQARQQVDGDFEVEVSNVAATTDDLVSALRAAGVPQEVTSDGAGRVVSGVVGRSSYDVEIGPTTQTVTVRSECLEVGRVQAVEISFVERYAVRPGEPSPDR